MLARQKAESPLSLALSYLARGWFLLPVYESTADGVCSCRDGKRCQNVGKHPRLKPGYRPSNDADQIKEWWGKWPNANIGIATGPSKLIVLDIDPRNGGHDTFADLEQTFGQLPTSPTVHTGGGGLHYFLRAPQHRECRSYVPGPGVEVKASTGYVVAPPSTHWSGGEYAWDVGAGFEDELPEAPEWVLRVAGSEDAKNFEPHPNGPLAGIVGKAFAAAGMVGRRVSPDVITVECPWENEHTTGSTHDSSTVVFSPTVGHILGWFHCSHSHCADRGPEEALKALGSDAVETAKRALGVAESWQPDNCIPKPEWKIPADLAKQGPAEEAAGKTAPDRPLPTEIWYKSLRHDGNGQLTKDGGNLMMYLMHHEKWFGCLGFDSFKGGLTWLKEPPELVGANRPVAGERVRQRHLLYIQQWFNVHGKVKFPRQEVEAAVDAAAAACTRNELQEYLTGLEWDGEERISTFGPLYLGTEDSDYIRKVIRWWLISAIARAMQPGCKADYMLVLEGEQGSRKSQALEALGGDWYLPSIPNLGQKDARQVLEGCWIANADELSGLTAASQEVIKSYLTTNEDRYRPAYGREVIIRKRTNVFAATTNLPEWIEDVTGGRRFWPVLCGRVRAQKVREDRDQIWAEAYKAWKAGEAWYPKTFEDEADVREEQAERYIDDPLIDEVARRVSISTEISMKEVLNHLGVPVHTAGMNLMRRIGISLRREGFRKVKGRGGVTWRRR